jgi:hypothetical protein
LEQACVGGDGHLRPGGRARASRPPAKRLEKPEIVNFVNFVNFAAFGVRRTESSRPIGPGRERPLVEAGEKAGRS